VEVFGLTMRGMSLQLEFLPVAGPARLHACYKSGDVPQPVA